MADPSKKENPRVLICAKTAAGRSAIEKLIEASRFSGRYETASALAEAKKRREEDSFEVIFMDSGLFADGHQPTFAAIQSFCAESAVILISDRDEAASSIKALEYGAEDYLVRDDLDLAAIEHAMTAALGRRKGRAAADAVNKKIAILETQVEKVFNHHNDPILILGSNHEIRFLNQKAVSLFETNEASLLGEVFPFAVAEGDVTELEIPVSGERIHTVELAAFEIIWKGEDSLLVLLREIRTGDEAGYNHLSNKERLNTLLESVSEAVIVSNRDGRIEQLNKSAAELLGSDPETSRGQLLTEMVQADPAPDRNVDHEALNSVGLLVGGIAHDFNNMLTVILGNIALARTDAEQKADISQRLVAAESAALQASSLSQQLLTFLKEGALNLTQTQIPEIIEECAEFILRGSNVDFKLTSEANLWSVDADKGRISQVISNLLINSDQAMPNGGIIEINLRNLNIRRAEVPGITAGDYLCIEVKDTGTGISPENLKQLFNPYFTTKENGNGLGLASSYSIVKSHKGTITADSSPGFGSIFRVYLPKSSSRARESTLPKLEKKVRNKKGIHRGQGRILLMDDMEAMLMVAEEILTMLGYEVACCGDGEEAIEAYKKAKESGNPFDAVVFDLTVPGGMGGEEAADILKQYDPDLIAIASSGYSGSGVMSDHKNSSFEAVVPKPYRIGGMSDALNAVLKNK
ncbi:MAG: response regulator [Verrucomicrobia bacterium]|jgi:signal transduction histidine kinase|nr:response regulator [Verrucomicrobiota bacterium]